MAEAEAHDNEGRSQERHGAGHLAIADVRGNGRSRSVGPYLHHRLPS